MRRWQREATVIFPAESDVNVALSCYALVQRAMEARRHIMFECVSDHIHVLLW